MKTVIVLIFVIVVNSSKSHGIDGTNPAAKDFYEVGEQPQVDVYGHIGRRNNKVMINLYNLTEVTLGSLFSPLLALRKLLSKYSGLQEQVHYEFVLFPDDIEMAFN